MDGAPGHLSSLRVESRGAIAILIIIHMLCKKWPNNLPRKEQINNILFDSDTVVTRSEADPKERKDFLSMDYDLWVETRKLLQIIPIKIEFKWIESHQDSKKKKKISNGAELNIQVDKLAGDYRKSMATHIYVINYY